MLYSVPIFFTGSSRIRFGSIVHEQVARNNKALLPQVVESSVGSDKFIDRDYRLSIVIGLSIDKRSISIIIIDKSGP